MAKTSPAKAAPEAPAPAKPSLVSAKAAPLTVEQLEARIAADQALLDALKHPPVEFPKMVKGHIFASREAQDAAGPDFADS